MIRKQLLIFIIISVVSSVQVVSCYSVKESNKEFNAKELNRLENNFQNLVEYFLELKTNNELPFMKSTDKITKFSAVQINQDKRISPILNSEMLADTNECGEVYYMEFKFEGYLYRHLFCIDDSIIKLVSSYRDDKEGWTKI